MVCESAVGTDCRSSLLCDDVHGAEPAKVEAGRRTAQREPKYGRTASQILVRQKP